MKSVAISRAYLGPESSAERQNNAVSPSSTAALSLQSLAVYVLQYRVRYALLMSATPIFTIAIIDFWAGYTYVQWSRSYG
jgi:hypothetical protein